MATWTRDDVVRLLERSGYQLRRHGAKHDVFDRDGAPRPVTVPRHRGDLSAGTVRSICRQIGISLSDAEAMR